MWAWVPSLVIALALVAVLPLWPYSRGWGYTPAGMVAVTLGTVVLFTLSVVPA